MKKILNFSLMLLAVTFIFSSCSSDDDDDIDTVITESSLPQTARSFISQHFSAETVTLVKEAIVVNPTTKTKYYVYLTNAYEVDFDTNGNWVEVDVDSKTSVELPTSVLSLLPAKALEYTRANYPTGKIESIKKITVNNAQIYEVDLNNGPDLKFAADGQFISAD